MINGNICYFFKGMEMHSESATVKNVFDSNTIAVSRDSDKQILNFVLCDGIWLLKNNTSSSLLFGTRFVCN